MLSVEGLLAYGPLGLFVVAFLESTIFPLPPDVLLLPLSMMSPRLSWWYAFLTSSASVLGALAGYAIGRKAGRPVLRRFIKDDSVREVEVLFARYGGWAVGIAAFTPLPFKLFTFCAGVFRVPLLTFTVASTIGRSARFFVEGALVYFMGESAQAYLGRNFEVATMLLTAALIAATVVIPRLLPVWRKTPAPREVGSTAPVVPGRLAGLREPACPPASHAGLLRECLIRLRSLGRFGTGCLVWAILAASFGVLAMTFFQDVAGAERETLNILFGQIWGLLPPTGGIRRALGVVANPWFSALSLVSGLIAFVYWKYPEWRLRVIGSGALRPRAPLSGLPSFLIRMAAVGVAAWVVDRTVTAYLGLVYGFAIELRRFTVLAPYMLLQGAFLLLTKVRVIWKIAGSLIAGALAFCGAGHSVLALGVDPVIGAASLVASCFTFCLTMAVLPGHVDREFR